MRNALIGLLAVISVLVSILFGLHTKYEDLLQNENRGLIDSWVRIQIPDRSSYVLYEEMEKLSKQTDCVFIREEIKEEKGRSVIERSILGPENYFERSTIELENGTYPQKEGEWIGTMETDDPNQTGVVFDLFDDLPMKFEFLSRDASKEGSYILCCGLEDQSKILDELAKGLNTTPEQLKTIHSQKQYDEGPVGIITAGIVVLVLLFVLVCLFYPISRLPEIGVYKLLGLSPWMIWLRLLGPVFAWGAGFSFLNVVLQSLLVPRISARYLVEGLFAQCIWLVACMALSTLSLFIIQRYTISSILKGDHHGRVPYWMSIGLKLVMIVLFGVLTPDLATVIQTISFQMQAANAYEKVADEMTLASYEFIDDEFQQMLEGNNVVAKKLEVFFHEIEQTANAKYVRPMLYDEKYFMQNNQSVPDDFEPVVAMFVNENELALYADLFSDPIESFYQKEGISVLVPDWMESTSTLDLVLSAIIYPYEVNDMDVEIVPYFYESRSKLVFTQNMRLVEQGFAFVEDPVFVCMKDTLSDALIGLGNQAGSNPIRIDDTKSNQNAIHAALSRAGLLENHVRFQSVYDAIFKETMEGMKKAALLMLGTVGFLFFVDGLASYYLSLITLTVRKKEIFIKKMLGYSLFARYKREWMVNGILYGVGLVVTIWQSGSMLGFGLYTGFILLDGVMSLILIRGQEKKTLGLLLKGE